MHHFANHHRCRRFSVGTTPSPKHLVFFSGSKLVLHLVLSSKEEESELRYRSPLFFRRDGQSARRPTRPAAPAGLPNHKLRPSATATPPRLHTASAPQHHRARSHAPCLVNHPWLTLLARGSPAFRKIHSRETRRRAVGDTGGVFSKTVTCDRSPRRHLAPQRRPRRPQRPRSLRSLGERR